MEESMIEEIKKIVHDILTAVRVAPQDIKVEWHKNQDRIYVSITAEQKDAGFLIGKDGRMLDALKEVIEVAASRIQNTRIVIYMDVNGYWLKIEAKALEDARTECKNVRQSGRAIKLEPMHPILRRFLHKELESEDGVYTESDGEGVWRRLVIKPAQKS
ncbi:protein jag [Elusimicrobiota bacterium]